MVCNAVLTAFKTFGATCSVGLCVVISTGVGAGSTIGVTTGCAIGVREDAYRYIKTIELITGHLEGLARKL